MSSVCLDAYRTREESVLFLGDEEEELSSDSEYRSYESDAPVRCWWPAKSPRIETSDDVHRESSEEREDEYLLVPRLGIGTWSCTLREEIVIELEPCVPDDEHDDPDARIENPWHVVESSRTHEYEGEKHERPDKGLDEVVVSHRQEYSEKSGKEKSLREERFTYFG